MGGATLYIVVCSARTRISRGFGRLREPRYLMGAMVGIGYLVFTLLIKQRAYAVRSEAVRAAGAAGAAGAAAASAGAFSLLSPAGGGVLLAFAAFASWILPFRSG